LREQEPGPRPDGGQIRGPAGGQERDPGNPDPVEKSPHLVFDHLGQGADNHQRRVPTRGHFRHERRQARILALRERRLDAAARIGENANARRVDPAESLSGTGQIQLDHLGRA